MDLDEQDRILRERLAKLDIKPRRTAPQQDNFWMDVLFGLMLTITALAAIYTISEGYWQ